MDEAVPARGWRPWGRSLPEGTWKRAALLAAGFVGLGELAAAFVFPPLENAVLWLPAGLSVAVLVRSPRRSWPLLLLVLAAAEFTSVLLHRDPPPVGVAWSVGNVLRTWMGASLVQRWRGRSVHMARVGDLLAVLLAGLLSPLVSATLGLLGVALGGGLATLPDDWLAWWLSDALGTVLVAPLVLAWWPSAYPPMGRRCRWELLLTVAGLGAVTQAVFASRVPGGVTASLAYLCIPLLVWAALRTGPRGASAASLVACALALWHTTAGRGPFGVLPLPVSQRVLAVQAFLATLTLTAFVVAALATERRWVERAHLLLARASAVLAQSPDVRHTMPLMAQMVVPELVPAFGLWVLEEDGRAQPLVEEGLTPRLAQRLRQQVEQVPGTTRLWRGERRAALLVPLRGRNGPLGMLALVDRPERPRPGPRERALAEDLAYRCALALENARLYAEAREAVEVRDEFITIAAHELRTPLTALKLRLQGLTPLLRQGPHAAQSLAALQAAARQATRLGRLVESLLDTARIHTRRLELHLEPVDLGQLAEEVSERFSEEAARAGCPLAFRAERDVVAWCDRDRVEQALLNLLSNAIKFGAGRPIEVEVELHGEWAHLAVVDQGFGIPPEQQERIFGRFERAVPTRQYGGLGLGLFLARQIADAHGGRVRVSSPPGGGARFVVELPTHPPAEAGGPPVPSLGLH